MKKYWPSLFPEGQNVSFWTICVLGRGWGISSHSGAFTVVLSAKGN